MHDVAKEAGVAHGTVSNVLNELPTVSAENREKVLAAVKAIGYVRNESARQLRTGRSGTIGMVLLDASNPYFADVAIGAEEEAASAGFTVFTCNSNSMSARESAYLTVLEENRVDGIVLACGTLTAELTHQLEAIEARGTPVVIVGHRFDVPRFDSVTGDNILGGKLAATHLLNRGHGAITVLTGPLEFEGFAERLAGVRGAMSARGLPDAAVTVVELPNNTISAGAAAAEAILQSATPPTAIFCANDLIALGALQAATRLGVNVPGDLAIVGYDDISFAAGAAVPLSSVRQPSLELGKTAMNLLLSALKHTGRPPQQVILEPQLLARSSTQGHPGSDRN